MGHFDKTDYIKQLSVFKEIMNTQLRKDLGMQNRFSSLEYFYCKLYVECFRTNAAHFKWILNAIMNCYQCANSFQIFDNIFYPYVFLHSSPLKDIFFFISPGKGVFYVIWQRQDTAFVLWSLIRSKLGSITSQCSMKSEERSYGVWRVLSKQFKSSF